MIATNSNTSVSVFGAGSWGTALALLLANNLNRAQQPGQVILWGRDSQRMEAIATTRCNSIFLPQHNLPHNVHIQSQCAAAAAAGELLVLAVPSLAIRAILENIKPELGRRHSGIVLACKGLEASNNQLMHELVADIISPHFPCAYLAGPSFALEVAEQMPTLVTMVSAHGDFAEQAATVFRNDFFRVYIGDDMVGTGIAGAIKNIIAIAAGVADGLGFGVNARAALICRGLKEMQRLACHIGGHEKTITGLAGLGDLVLTCTSTQSRNYRFGFLLAQSYTQESAQQKIAQVVEGVQAAAFVCHLAQANAVDMPICQAVMQLLQEQLTPQQAAMDLLQRAPKAED